jgi:hypothetical protein
MPSHSSVYGVHHELQPLLTFLRLVVRTFGFDVSIAGCFVSLMDDGLLRRTRIPRDLIFFWFGPPSSLHVWKVYGNNSRLWDAREGLGIDSRGR